MLDLTSSVFHPLGYDPDPILAVNLQRAWFGKNVRHLKLGFLGIKGPPGQDLVSDGRKVFDVPSTDHVQSAAIWPRTPQMKL